MVGLLRRFPEFPKMVGLLRWFPKTAGHLPDTKTAVYHKVTLEKCSRAWSPEQIFYRNYSLGAPVKLTELLVWNVCRWFRCWKSTSRCLISLSISLLCLKESLLLFFKACWDDATTFLPFSKLQSSEWRSRKSYKRRAWSMERSKSTSRFLISKLCCCAWKNRFYYSSKPTGTMLYHISTIFKASVEQLNKIN